MGLRKKLLHRIKPKRKTQLMLKKIPANHLGKEKNSASKICPTHPHPLSFAVSVHNILVSQGRSLKYFIMGNICPPPPPTA